MKKIIFTAFSIMVFIFLWQIVSLVINSPLILPPPAAVAKDFVHLLGTEAFYKNLGASFLRVVAAYLISMTFGTALGFLSGRFPSIKHFLAFPLAILRTTPIVALILILVFALPSSYIPATAAILMALPIVATALCSGTESFFSDSKFNDMLSIFRFSRRQKFLYALIPHLEPHFKTAAVSTFGLTWKVVAAGEILSLPRFALGTSIAQAQVHMETSQVLANTVALVSVSYCLEILLKFICRDKKIKNESTPPDPKSYMPEIKKNERVAIIAPSGFGKTTLLDYISRTGKNVSYCFQEPRLLNRFTVFQNVELPLLNRFEKNEAEKIADHFISGLSLEEKRDVPVKLLSGGQAQRTGLARALAFPSETLLLDEPFNAQDYELKIKIMDFIKQELDKNPRTMIFVTHDERDGNYLCQRTIKFPATEKNI